MEQTQQFDRFKDAPWFDPERETSAIVGGAGGIGSWLTFLLSRAGVTPIVFDFDIIEAHNIGGQLFRSEDIGEYKVTALNNIIRQFCGDSISYFVERITPDSPHTPFMFSAFDNMQARKDLFAAWKKSIDTALPGTPIFIDGRLTMEQLQIFCVTPDRIEQYEEHLFDDSEVEDAPCTMRQTSHSACMIASLMTGFFTNHLTNIYEMEIVRDVPFFHEYFIPMNLTVSE